MPHVTISKQGVRAAVLLRGSVLANLYKKYYTRVRRGGDRRAVYGKTVHGRERGLPGRRRGGGGEEESGRGRGRGRGGTRAAPLARRGSKYGANTARSQGGACRPRPAELAEAEALKVIQSPLKSDPCNGHRHVTPAIKPQSCKKYGLYSLTTPLFLPLSLSLSLCRPAVVAVVVAGCRCRCHCCPAVRSRMTPRGCMTSPGPAQCSSYLSYMHVDWRPMLTRTGEHHVDHATHSLASIAIAPHATYHTHTDPTCARAAFFFAPCLKRNAGGSTARGAHMREDEHPRARAEPAPSARPLSF